VEYLADLDTAPDQLVVRSLDVGNDEEQRLGGTWCYRREVGAELDRAARTRRGELDQTEFVGSPVGVKAPPQSSIELLSAINIRDGDDDYLKPHVDAPGLGGPSGVAAAVLGGAHSGLPWLSDNQCRTLG
jgi:hypothetical protein